MSETTGQDSSDSHCNLIKVQHVGVTAALKSPLANLLGSSPDSQMSQQPPRVNYNAFKNDAQGSSTDANDMSSIPSVLYEMHAEPETPAVSKMTSRHPKPHRIEFQRYCKPKHKPVFCPVPPRKHNKPPVKTKQKATSTVKTKKGFLARVVESLDDMCKCQSPNAHHSIIDDLPEPQWNKKAEVRHTCVGVYPFEHGNADYLSTTDSHPKIRAIVLADRATTYATHFWAELFGILHIAVAFIVAFVLQLYRFILYSLVNTLFVGMLHMTSDYMVKPALTVVFNGFLQPPMIFIYNIFCSMRDIFEPVADTMNNFMRPVATVGRSLRLVNINYRNVRRFAKDV